jgi:hypothetical protein
MWEEGGGAWGVGVGRGGGGRGGVAYGPGAAKELLKEPSRGQGARGKGQVEKRTFRCLGLHTPD